MHVYQFSDFLLVPVYLLIIYFIALAVKNTRYANDPAAKYFIPALTVKIFGAIALGLIYEFYYTEGDTTSFYLGARSFLGYFLDDPVSAIAAIPNYTPENVSMFRVYFERADYSYIWRGSAEYLVIMIAGLINLISFNSYYVIAIIFGAISFTGMWALFRTFYRIFPDIHYGLAISILFIPSVVFWGSGILKDTVALGSLGWLTYSSYQLFIKGRFRLINLIILVVSFYLIKEIKAYILLGFLPALIFWVINTHKSKIKSRFVRISITPFFITVTILIGILIIGQIGDMLGKYSLENLESTAKATQNWHTIASEGGSGYSLGPVEYTPLGMLRAFPASVNVTLFRPYLWEASGIVVLFSALESLLLLLLSIRIFFKTGPLKFFSIIFGNPNTLFCFLFVVIFAFAVGFTSYNFGALVRYKIPVIPFYLSMLFMIQYLGRSKKVVADTNAEVESDTPLLVTEEA